jgi:hypothetical protein
MTPSAASEALKPTGGNGARGISGIPLQIFLLKLSERLQVTSSYQELLKAHL